MLCSRQYNLAINEVEFGTKFVLLSISSNRFRLSRLIRNFNLFVCFPLFSLNTKSTNSWLVMFFTCSFVYCIIVLFICDTSFIISGLVVGIALSITFTIYNYMEIY